MMVAQFEAHLCDEASFGLVAFSPFFEGISVVKRQMVPFSPLPLHSGSFTRSYSLLILDNRIKIKTLRSRAVHGMSQGLQDIESKVSLHSRTESPTPFQFPPTREASLPTGCLHSAGTCLALSGQHVTAF